MKQGALFFDETADRYDIRFDLADYYGGLHCGECLEVFTGGAGSGRPFLAPKSGAAYNTAKGGR